MLHKDSDINEFIVRGGSGISPPSFLQRRPGRRREIGANVATLESGKNQGPEMSHWLDENKAAGRSNSRCNDIGSSAA